MNSVQKGFNRTFIQTLIVVMGIGLLGCQPGPESPPMPSPVVPSSKVRMTPNAELVHPGAVFNRTIEVENVENTYYAAFDITYDPSVVEYVNASEGSFLNQNGSAPTLFGAALVNETQGRIKIGITRLGQIGEVSGMGIVVTLSFKAVRSGTTTIAFANPKALRNLSDRDVVVQTWGDVTVTVQ